MSWSADAVRKHITSVQSRLRTEIERKQQSLSFAQLCMKTKLYPDATMYLLSYLQLKPSDYRGHKLLGESYEKQGEIGKAIASYKKALDLKGNQRDLTVKVAELYCQLPTASQESKKAWVERVEKVAPRHSALLRLKGCVASNGEISSAGMALSPSDNPKEHLEIVNKFAVAGELLEAHIYCQKVKEEGLFLTDSEWNKGALVIHEKYLDSLRKAGSPPEHMVREICSCLEAQSRVFEFQARTARVGWNQMEMASLLRKYDKLLGLAHKCYAADTTSSPITRAARTVAMQELCGRFYAMAAQMMMLTSGGPKHSHHQLVVACLLSSLKTLPPTLSSNFPSQVASEIERWHSESLTRWSIVAHQLQLNMKYYTEQGTQVCIDRYNSNHGKTHALKQLLIDVHVIPPGSAPGFNSSESFLVRDGTLAKTSLLDLPSQNDLEVTDSAYIEQFRENFPALVWLALMYVAVDEKPPLCRWLLHVFPSLPLAAPLATIKRADPDTLCVRDIEAFFLLAMDQYVDTHSAVDGTDRVRDVFHHLLTEVPCWEKLSLPEHFSTSWANFHLLCGKKLSVLDLLRVKKSVSVALNSVRALPPLQLSVSQIILLARHFNSQAEESAKSGEGLSVNERANTNELLVHSCYYWQALLDLVVPVRSVGPFTPDPRKYITQRKTSLFSVNRSPRASTPAKHEKVSKEIECEALMSLAHAALFRRDCEQALSLYERVATPAAAWNQSQVYLLLANKEDDEIQMSLFQKAADSIALAISRTPSSRKTLRKKLEKEQQDILRLLGDTGHESSSSSGTSPPPLTTPITSTLHTPASKDRSGLRSTPPKSTERDIDSAVKERDTKLASMEKKLRHLEEEVMEMRRLRNTPTCSPSYPQPHFAGKMSGSSPQGVLSPPQHGIPVLKYSPSPLGPHAATNASDATPGSSSQHHSALFQPLPVGGGGVPTSPQQPSAIKGSVVEWGVPLAQTSSLHSQPPQSRPLVNQFAPPLIPFVSQFTVPSSLSAQTALKQPISSNECVSGMVSSFSSQASFVFTPGQLQTPLYSTGQPSHDSSMPSRTAVPPRLFQFGQIQSLGPVGNSPFQFSSPSPPPTKTPAMFGPSAPKQPTMFGPSVTKHPAVVSDLKVANLGMDLGKGPAPAFQQVGMPDFASSVTVSSSALSSFTYAVQPSNTSAVAIPLVPPSRPIFKASAASQLDSTFSFTVPTSTVLSTTLAGSVDQPPTSVPAGPLFKPLQFTHQLGGTPPFTTLTVSAAVTAPAKPLFHLPSMVGSVSPFQSMFTTSTTDTVTKSIDVPSFSLISSSSSLFVPPLTATVSVTTSANASPFCISHKFPAPSTSLFTLTSATSTSNSPIAFPPLTTADGMAAFPRLAPSFSLSSTSGGVLLATSTPVSKPPLLPIPIKEPNDVSQNSDDEGNTSFNTSTEFTPVVSLPEVTDLKSGEEEDTVHFSHKGKLYRFENTCKQWKERGVGIIKILQNTRSGKFRVLMRRDQVLKVCCNHLITCDMTLKSYGSGDRAWVWCTPSDYADEVAKPEKLIVKFKHARIAKLFQRTFLKATGVSTSPTEEPGSDEPASSSITSIASDDGSTKQKSGSGILEGAGSPALLASLGWFCKLCSAQNLASSSVCGSCGTSQSPPTRLPSSLLGTAAMSVPGSESKDSANTFGKFVQPTDVWTCSTLSKPVISHPVAGSPLLANVSGQQQQSSESLLAKFAPPLGSWSCDMCLVNNKAGDIVCVACRSPKPDGTVTDATAIPKSTSASPIASKMPQQPSNNQLSVPIPPTGFWSCEVCWVSNKVDDLVCAACQNRKPGTASSDSLSFPTTTQQPSTVGISGGVKVDLLQGTSLSALAGAHGSAQQTGGMHVNGSMAGGVKIGLLQGRSLSSLTGVPCSTTTTPNLGGAKLPGELSFTPSIVARPFHGGQGEESEKEEGSEEEVDEERSADDADISCSSAGSADRSAEFSGNADDEVVIVAVKMPPQNLVKRAEEYQLPAGFYLYEMKPPCPGCRGCDDQLEGFHWSELSTSTSQLAMQHNCITTLSVSEAAGTSPGPNLFGSHLQNSTLSFGGLASQQSGFSLQLTEPGERGFSVSTKPLFSSPAKEESNLEEEASCHFKPLVNLVKLDKIETGEEDEEVLFCRRAKLFRFDNKANQWKDRGVGEMKVLQNKITGKGRLVMRREQILKLCCNHMLSPELSLTPHGESDRTWMWFAPSDLSEDEPRPEKFVVKFKNKETANEFKEAFYKGCDHEKVHTQEGSMDDDNSDTDASSENKEQASSSTSDAKSSIDHSQQAKPLVSESQVGSKALGTGLSSLGGLFKTSGFPSFADIASQQNTQNLFNFSTQSSSEKPFVFSLTDKPIFAPPTSKDNDDGGDEGRVPEEEPTVFFKPLVSLPELEDISTGEEGEEVLFCNRAKLFRLNKATREWKERGVGEIKILKHRVSRKTRVLMRREQILKVCCNHSLVAGMSLTSVGTQGRCWAWFTPCDYADEEPQPENFSVRFKTLEIADKFRKVYEMATSCDATPESNNITDMKTSQAQRDVKEKEEDSADEEEQSSEREEDSEDVDQESECTEEENEGGNQDMGNALSYQEIEDDQVGGTTVSANLQCSDQAGSAPSFKLPFDLDHGLKLPQQEDSPVLSSCTITTTSSIMSPVLLSPAVSSLPSLTSPKAHLQGEALSASLLPRQTPHDRVGVDEQELFSAPAVLCDSSSVGEHEGVMHVLRHSDQEHIRVLMLSSDPDSHVLCSHVVTSLMSLRKGTPSAQHPEGVAWSWSTSADYSTGCQRNSWFSVSFVDAETASGFHDAFSSSSSFSVMSAFELRPVSTGSEEEKDDDDDNEDILFPDASKPKLTVATTDDNIEEVEFVHEVLPEEELIKKAKELQLPSTFYLYLQKPPCPGCRGCGEDPVIEYKNESPTSLEDATVNETCIPQTGGNQSQPPNSGQLSEASQMPPLFALSSTGFSSFADLASHSNSGFSQLSEGFQFAGAGQALFAQSSKPHEEGSEEDPEREANVHFQPVVQVPEQYSYQSSEDNAEELFCQRGKLYRFDSEANQWKERGLGNMKVLKHSKSGSVQLLMRREQTHKICCNHIITGEMGIMEHLGSKKALVWGTPADYSDEQPIEQKLIIRFKHDETASEFRTLFEQAVQNAQRTPPVVTRPLMEPASPQLDVTSSDEGRAQWVCSSCMAKNEPGQKTCEACSGNKEVEEHCRNEDKSQECLVSTPPSKESLCQSEVLQPGSMSAVSSSQDACQHQQSDMPPLDDLDLAGSQATPPPPRENTDS